jgi:type II secretion system protein J
MKLRVLTPIQSGSPLPLSEASAQSPRAAFTLIELVISAALMSIILVSGYLCLRAVVSGQKMIDTRADIAQNGRVAMALMTADLRAATPLSEEFEFLGLPRRIGSMQADNLDFATHNYTPRKPREGDWCEVSYFLDKNPRTGRFSLWRRRDPTPDPEPLSGGSREEIAEGVRGLRFEYYDGFEWYDEWGDAEGRPQSERALLLAGNLSGMPEAVRITLWLDANSPLKDDANEDEPESPLVFQTIVRLNLAGREWESSSVDSGTAEAPQSGPAPGGRN